MSRRPPTLRHDAPEAPRPWLIRLPDGQVRGPLGREELASLVEIGVVSETTEIAPAEHPTWQAIAALPLWSELQPTRKPIALRTAKTPAGPAPSASAAGDAPVIATDAMARARRFQEREVALLQRRLSLRDAGRFFQVVAYAAAVVGCVCIGDIFLFGLRPLWGSAFVILPVVALSRVVASWIAWKIVQ